MDYETVRRATRDVLLRSCVVLFALAGIAVGQELPKSGAFGVDVFYSTTSSGTSQLSILAPALSLTPIPLGTPVATIPSRWAHRRRSLGALETQIAYAPPAVLLTPMGDALGNGAIHFVDARVAPITSLLLPTGNPAAYDLAVVPSLGCVFSLEDDGVGSTLRGFSYATPGQLVPLSPPSLALAGRPAAFVSRIGIDPSGVLVIPTTAGIHLVTIAASAPQMHLTASSTSNGAPVTNPIRVERTSGVSWLVGTANFSPTVANKPIDAGWFATDLVGVSSAGSFGNASAAPNAAWVPAVGTHELATCVSSNGSDAFAYLLLRDSDPAAGYIKGGAVGVVRMIGANPFATGTIAVGNTGGEPFGNPSTFGSRIAFETSFGPPFAPTAQGEGERIAILYAPTDPLAASTTNGSLGIPAPLGGRIDNRGMDRPLWSSDGLRVFAFSSNFLGAPNPLVAGVESLFVPTGAKVSGLTSPQVQVSVSGANRSILLPTRFDSHDDGIDSLFAGLSFVGGVYTNGTAAALGTSFGSFGQLQVPTSAYLQPAGVPVFPTLLPASFEFATNPIGIPGKFGARRASFNVNTGLGLGGVTLIGAVAGKILLQPTGNNFLAALGLTTPISPFEIALPSGEAITSEFLSL